MKNLILILVMIASFQIKAAEYSFNVLKVDTSTASEAEAVSGSELLVRDFWVQASNSNGSTMFIGNSGVNTSSGFELMAGEEVRLLDEVGITRRSEVSVYFDLSSLYFVSDNQGDYLNIFYLLP